MRSLHLTQPHTASHRCRQRKFRVDTSCSGSFCSLFSERILNNRFVLPLLAITDRPGSNKCFSSPQLLVVNARSPCFLLLLLLHRSLALLLFLLLRSGYHSVLHRSRLVTLRHTTRTNQSCGGYFAVYTD